MFLDITRKLEFGLVLGSFLGLAFDHVLGLDLRLILSSVLEATRILGATDHYGTSTRNFMNIFKL